MSNDWLTVTQASELSGYHRVYLTDLIRSGKIEARKFGPIWQVNKSALLAYIREAKKSKDGRRGPRLDRT